MPTRQQVRKARLTLGLAVAAALILAAVQLRCRSTPFQPQVAAPVAAPARVRLPFEPPETLTYEFGWNGLPAATLRITTRREGEGPDAPLVVEYEGRSLPAVRAVWKMDATGRTVVDPATLRPLSAVASSRSPSKEKSYETRFDWEAGSAEVKKRKTRDGKTKEKTVQLKAGLDMPTALLALRAASDGQNLRVISGTKAYQIVVTDRGKETVKMPDGPQEALHYELSIRKLPKEGEEPEAESLFRSFHVWLKPEGRVPLKLETQVLVGHIFAELVRTGEADADPQDDR